MKKKHPEHVNLERWLVSYADFITLLFAFFVIMYAISMADIAKFKKVSASIKQAFSAAAGPVSVIDIGGGGGGNTLNQLEQTEPQGGRVLNLPAGRSNTAADKDPQLQEIRDLLEESISLELGISDVSDKMQMQFDSRGLLVRLAAKGFFGNGEVGIHSDLLPLLDRIGRVLAGSKRLFRIEGHADRSEASPQNYPTAWELSAARAAWLAKYWIEKFAIDPIRVGVSGYSYFRPLSYGKGEWSSAKNRRIEIVILNNQYESP